MSLETAAGPGEREREREREREICSVIRELVSSVGELVVVGYSIDFVFALQDTEYHPRFLGFSQIKRTSYPVVLCSWHLSFFQESFVMQMFADFDYANVPPVILKSTGKHWIHAWRLNDSGIKDTTLSPKS